MNKINTSKKLSSKATGMPLKRTKMSTDNRQGVVEEISIYPLVNKFQIKYRVERFDTNGNPFTDVEYKTKTVNFKDIPEQGTVEYDDDGNEKPETYEKTIDENLQVTNWYKQLGVAIMGAAVAYIEASENL